MSQRDKQAVAASFSLAAKTYDSVAYLQRQLGHHLLTLSPDRLPGPVLDLGCGTGYFLPRLSERSDGTVVALDLATGMLAYAQEAGWRY